MSPQLMLLYPCHSPGSLDPRLRLSPECMPVSGVSSCHGSLLTSVLCYVVSSEDNVLSWFLGYFLISFLAILLHSMSQFLERHLLWPTPHLGEEQEAPFLTASINYKKPKRLGLVACGFFRWAEGNHHYRRYLDSASSF